MDIYRFLELTRVTRDYEKAIITMLLEESVIHNIKKGLIESKKPDNFSLMLYNAESVFGNLVLAYITDMSSIFRVGKARHEVIVEIIKHTISFTIYIHGTPAAVVAFCSQYNLLLHLAKGFKLDTTTEISESRIMDAYLLQPERMFTYHVSL